MSVSEPGKIITPWAESGLKNPIPPTANPATGRAGFDQGFSAINMTAKEAGGIPPFGQDFNGIFYEVTNILRYMQAGGQPTFDAALATAIGGYPKGAMVLGSDGVTLWQSKVDSNSTNPNTDSSDWGAFDIGLKEDLAAPSGSDIVGFQQAGAGSVPRTAQDKMRELVTPQDFGAAGDGVTNDQVAFDALDALPENVTIDLLGKTYCVSVLPTRNGMKNGFIKRVSDNKIFEVSPSVHLRFGNQNIIFGTDAGASMPAINEIGGANPYSNIAIGDSSLFNNQIGKINIAHGDHALYSLTAGRYNVAIGGSSQYYCNSNDGGSLTGTRNTSVGVNSLRFNEVGYSNVAMGRNTGQSISSSNYNVVIGTGAMAGSSPQGLDDATIENQTPLTSGNQVHIGADAGQWSNGNGNVSVGYRAAHEIKKGTLIAIGIQAGENIEKGSSYDGYQRLFGDKLGTYIWEGNSVTATVMSHGLSAGWRIYAGIGGHEIGYFTISSILSPDVFVIDTPYLPKVGPEVGDIEIREWITTATVSASTQNIAIGRIAMRDSIVALNSVAVGDFTMQNLSPTNCVALGTFALNSKVGAISQKNIAIGYSAMRNNGNGGSNVAIGDFAIADNDSGSRITAIGANALRYVQSGPLMTSFSNVSGIGSDTKVSGDNQVQLGDTSTTTYVYGTVQNRSDARDKTDIQDTELGIEFIMGLRPVDGRWDMRDDYLEEYQVQVGIDQETAEPIFETRLRALPKDGSKARARKHHWFIAQEVKELCDKLGVAFGGYQDHSINGGCDVLSLGYDEFIPPTVKAVQQCWTRLDELEKRIAALE